MAAAVVAPSVVAVVPATSLVAEVSNDQSIVEAPVAAHELRAATSFEASAVAVETIPVEVVDIQPIAEVAATPIIVQAEPKAAEAAPVAAPVVVDIEKALEQSGLVMVETSSDKAQSWQPEAAANEEAPRPRRKRPAPVVVSDEPLMMVETQK
jgi:ribonuclease E